MRLEQLQYFVEVAHCCSLSTASRKLGLSQQALSAAVKSLEKELGVPLLLRTSKGCGLTLAGEQVLAYAESVLAGYQALREEVAGIGHSARSVAGCLRIYCNSPFYFFFHPQLIRDFCREYPLWKVAITDLPTPEVYQRLNAPHEPHEWNIGIVNVPCEEDGRLSPLFEPPPPLMFTPLARGGYQACVSRRSPLAGSKSLSLSTLLKGPIIIGASAEAMITPLHYLLKKHGKVNFLLSASTPNVWAMMIAGNTGAGLLHDAVLHEAPAAAEVLEDVALIPLREKMTACTGYVLSAGAGDAAGGLPEPVQAFLGRLPRLMTL